MDTFLFSQYCNKHKSYFFVTVHWTAKYDKHTFKRWRTVISQQIAELSYILQWLYLQNFLRLSLPRHDREQNKSWVIHVLKWVFIMRKIELLFYKRYRKTAVLSVYIEILKSEFYRSKMFPLWNILHLYIWHILSLAYIAVI